MSRQQVTTLPVASAYCVFRSESHCGWVIKMKMPKGQALVKLD
jgi:hypothetical protein